MARTSQRSSGRREAHSLKAAEGAGPSRWASPSSRFEAGSASEEGNAYCGYVLAYATPLCTALPATAVDRCRFPGRLRGRCGAADTKARGARRVKGRDIARVASRIIRVGGERMQGGLRDGDDVERPLP